jgi:hypothetical protein
MMRRGWISEGCCNNGKLRLTLSDGTSVAIAYWYNLSDPEDASMNLKYPSRTRNGKRLYRLQRVRLVYTKPPYGGRRWWMECPETGERVGKLYLPVGGDRFASRKAWKLAYRSQRASERERTFQQLFALQRRLGCPEGWEEPISRPKGMWQRTYDRLEKRYRELDAECWAHVRSDLAILRCYAADAAS